jgi:hypothetical protein
MVARRSTLSIVCVFGRGCFRPSVYPWDAWRPEEVARGLRGVDLPWYVAAGWSIDLFLGGERREHEDLEIAAPAARFAELAAALPGLEFFAINDRLAYSIEHEPEALEGSHQTWGLDRSAGVWRIDVFREPADGETWICRRDESIRLSGGEHIERTTEGLPYARPELTLLFKESTRGPRTTTISPPCSMCSNRPDGSTSPTCWRSPTRATGGSS